jgi:hypothetical protein
VGCHPLEFALVRPTTCPASRHLVCFGNLILNRDLHVGNCFVAYHLELFCPFRPVDVVWWCMADVIAGHIPLALDVFKYFVGDRLILL